MSDVMQLLKDWNQKSSIPLIRPHRTMDEAEDLIHALQVELAGKVSVIELLNKRVDEYRLERNRHTNDITALEARLDQ